MMKAAIQSGDQLLNVIRAASELISTLNKSQLINLVLLKAAEISGCSGISIVLFSEMEQEPPEVYTHGLSKGFAETLSALSSGLIKETLMSGGHEHFDHLPGSCEEGIRSATCFSLAMNGNSGGLLYFFDFDHYSQPENRIENVKIFSAFAASALENSRLYTEKDREVEQIKNLNDAILSITSESNTGTLLQKITDHAAFLLDTEAAYLIEFRRDGDLLDEIYISGTLGSEPLNIEPPTKTVLGNLLTTHHLLNKKSRELTASLMDLPLPGFRNLLAVSLTCQKNLIGILLVANKANRVTFQSEDENLLSTYACHAARAIRNARMQDYNKEMAITDGLTGLLNHREFQVRLENEVKRCLRYKHSLTLLMIDIDHFKLLNDTCGHPAGDRVLQEVAQLIKSSVREIDTPARYGGEEFIVILPETSNKNALIVVERIRKRLSEMAFSKTPTNEGFHITVSIGTSTFPEDSLKPEELISKCDQALYFAKREGRNCFRRYDETIKAYIDNKENAIDSLLKGAEVEVMQSLAAAVDAKNLFTRGHSDEVVQYAVMLAKALKLPVKDVENLHFAGILHNIGTVSIPEKILNKPGPLTDEERKLIQGHPEVAEMILKKTGQLENTLPAILCHHEWFDGQGYPNGLKGKKIPLSARILAVAEAYQAMTSERPYRPRFSKEKALQQLSRSAGTQFDPEIVEAFVHLVS